MNLGGILHLGIAYLIRNRIKTLLLVGAFTVVLSLPPLIRMVVNQVEQHIRARAQATPLLLGMAGSPLELAFNGLYFSKPTIKTMPYGEVSKINEEGLGEAIPLYARFHAGDYHVVGTSLDYFDFRNLKIARGRQLIHLGDCLLGSRLARSEHLAPGDSIISSPETVFDLAGVYPLKMKICGVLAPTGTADDRAVFVDLKTAWVIQGIGHGHQAASKTPGKERLPGSGGDDGTIKLNASVVEYNEITPENEALFHFHMEEADRPITAAIVLPKAPREQAILKARYARSNELQLISPGREMGELFATVFSVQRMVNWILGVIGVAAVAIIGLVFLLSYRLRIAEFENLRNIGADPSTMRLLIAFEAGFVVLCSLVMALALLGIGKLVTPTVIRSFLG